MLHARLLVTVLAATLGMAVVASAAGAEQITAEPGGAITATSLGRLTVTAGELGTITCRVTLSGSVNASIENSRGGNYGSFTSAATGECAGGTMTMLIEAGNPWRLELAEEIRLESTPELLGIHVVMAQVRVVEGFGFTCLFAGTMPTALEGERLPMVTRLMLILSTHLSKVSGTVCPAQAEVRGTLSPTQENDSVPCYIRKSSPTEEPVVIPAEKTRVGGTVTQRGEAEIAISGTPIAEAFGKFRVGAREMSCQSIRGGGGSCPIEIELVEGATRPATGFINVPIRCPREARREDFLTIQARA